VSSHSLLPKISIRIWGIALAAVCTLLALVLPMHDLEPFLLMLSSVFVPLYGVILGRLGGGAAGSAMPALKVDLPAAGIWIVGIGVFQALTQWAPQWGATLPTLLLTGIVAFATRKK